MDLDTIENKARATAKLKNCRGCSRFVCITAEEVLEMVAEIRELRTELANWRRACCGR